MNLWDKFTAFPPVLIRLLARVPHGRPLTNEEIHERSQLPLCRVDYLSRQTSWDGIDLPTARAFMHGCRLDVFDERAYRRARVYLKDQLRPQRKGRVFHYLTRAPAWREIYLPLLDIYQKYLLCPSNLSPSNPANRPTPPSKPS